MARGYIWLALGLCGCLPDDTRPPPGRINVTISSDEALTQEQGILTADGWRVSFSRFLITLGEADLDDCSEYNETDYLRLFSLPGAGAQRVSTVYGLGKCSFGFEMLPPTRDTVPGAGVTEADYRLMGIPASDGYAVDAGAALYVSGTAVSGGVEKRFTWSFRRGYKYEFCETDAAVGVTLTGDSVQTVDIQVRSSTLFVARPDDDSAELRFAPFAAADDSFGNADGEVTLSELAAVPFELAAEFPEWQTLADYLYLGLVPSVPRFKGTGTCEYKPEEDDD